MGTIEDSIPGIFRALQESAVTMQQRGGIGCDFSAARNAGPKEPAALPQGPYRSWTYGRRRAALCSPPARGVAP